MSIIETQNPEILDCTFRDGGYTCNWEFSDEQFKDLYETCLNANIEYCEVGFRRPLKPNSKFGKWYHTSEELLNRVVKPLKGKCKIAVMCYLGDINFSDFVERKDSCIDMIRVLMPYHTGDKNDATFDEKLFLQGIETMNRFINMGYEVTFNLGRIDKVPLPFLERICKGLNETQIKTFYIADTYGNLTFKNSKKILKTIRDNLKPEIGIGYHAHDNLGNATSKTLSVCELSFSEGRPSIIDGTMFGYGRGSGNAKIELFLVEYNKNYLSTFSYIDKWISPFKQVVFGYNLLYIISGTYSMNVNYPLELIENHHITLETAIETMFEIIKRNKHHFYDVNCIIEILKTKNENILEE